MQSIEITTLKKLDWKVVLIFLVIQSILIYSLLDKFYLLILPLLFFLIFLFVLANLERSLYLVLFSMAFSQSLPAFDVGGRTVGTSFDYILIPMVISAWLIKKVFSSASLPSLKIPFKAPAILFTLFCLFSLGLANFRIGFTQLLDGIFPFLSWVGYLLLAFVIVDTVNTPQQIKHLFYLMFALALVIAGIGIVEYLVFAPFRIGSIFGSIFRGIKGNSNALGTYLAIFALISLNFFLNYKKGKKHLWILAFLVFVLGLIFTFSRSSWLGFTIGSIFLIWRSNKRLLIFWIALALLISPIWLPEKVTHRISTIGEAAFNNILIHKFLNIDYRLIQTQAIERYGVYGYNIEVVSAALRYSAWKDGVDIFRRFPLFGSGYRLNKHFGRMITAEDLYLDILATTGMLGFSAFLWMGYKLIKLPRSILKETKEPFHKSLAASYISILILLSIVSLTGSVFFDPKLLGAFWFLTGLISSIRNSD
jgi:hypothetical protein